MPAQKWSSKRRAVFLDALAATGNVSHAAREARMSRSRAYQLKAADPDFAAEWSDALEAATDALDAEARRRAVDGVEIPHFHQGQVTGTVRKYSDALLMFLLRAHRPELYRERAASTNGGANAYDDTEDPFAGAKNELAERLARLGPRDDTGGGEDHADDPE
jgi:hypothetical protein